MNLLYDIVFVVIYGYLTFWSGYFLLFAIAGCFLFEKEQRISDSVRFLVLLPAYKEDTVIVESARHAASHNYPSDKFDVVVIADKLKPETIATLRKIPVNVLEVLFDHSTKSKSLRAALKSYSNNYEAVVILDADNIMADNFLLQAAGRISVGETAVQGHRCAKNLHTSLALLDAISEEINNRIFRAGHKVMGLSSALIGSAMVFEFELFAKIMQQIDAVGGFDRELELRLIQQGVKIDYMPKAFVLDEKTAQQDIFKKQRIRWLSAQYYYFKRFGLSGLKALFSGDFDYFDKVIQGAQVPRIVLPGLLFFCLLISFICSSGPLPIYWEFSLIASCFALLISIPRKYWNIRLIKAVFILPVVFINMLSLLFKLRGANKKFIHTPHSQAHATS